MPGEMKCYDMRGKGRRMFRFLNILVGFLNVFFIRMRVKYKISMLCDMHAVKFHIRREIL